MDEMSWRAKLAKSNINILNIAWNDDNTIADVFFEFMYRPYNGQIKWCKTWVQVAGEVVADSSDREYQKEVSGDDICRTLKNEALKLRKELEN